MLAELRSAARRVGDQRALRSLLIDCRRLLSERGEANSVAIAAVLAWLAGWFNRGFRHLEKPAGTARARLVGQTTRKEAVAEIDGGNARRRPRHPDRRCFAFFHPQLPDEPLIFVEVALLPE